MYRSHLQGSASPITFEGGTETKITSNKRCVIYQNNEEDLIYTETVACNHTQ